MRPACAVWCVMPAEEMLAGAQLAPSLRIAPSRLAFTAVAEGEVPPPQAIEIVTADGSPFDFQIEINFRVPPEARAGDLKLVVTQQGVSNNEVILPVR